MRHGVPGNFNLHQGLMSEKKLERADLVWSRMTLEPNEVLFVKVSISAAEHIGTINDMIERAFGTVNRDRVLVFVEGTLELTKVGIGCENTKP
jgi:hypothetical protein